MANASSLTTTANALWNTVKDTFSQFGYSTTLTSAGRTPAQNVGIAGASSTSQHIGGNAFDFQVRDASGSIVDPLKVQATIASLGFSYGQNIAEFGAGMGPRNHLSVPTSTLTNQNLIGRDGKYTSNGVDLAKAITVSTSKSTKSMIDSIESNMLQSLGMSKDTADTLTNPNAGVMEATGAALGANQYILRGSVAIVAILLLGAAIFAISKGGNPATIIAKGIKA